MKKINVLLASVLASGLMMSASSTMAKPDGMKSKDVAKQMIKVKAEQGENVIVKVGKDGVRNAYEFSFEELDNLDNVSAKMDDLDPELKSEVLELLSKVTEQDASFVEFKDAEITVDGKETEMFLVKTKNGDDSMHIEIDIEGEGVNSGKRHYIQKFISGGKGFDKRSHKKIKKIMAGEHKDMTKVITKLISKADLNDEQIAKIRASLDAKS